MANQWLTGAGVPALETGTVTDYYRDTESNLVYYRENSLTWTVVPAFTPDPDGIGTTWLSGVGAPTTEIGSSGDYYYDDNDKIVYRKSGADWTAKGSLDFIGIYGVQWGNGLGAPASTVPLNALPIGSFYLDVETSDIYFKDPTNAWILKGQLGGGGGGGGSINLVTTFTAVVQTDVTSAITPSVVFEMATAFGQALQDLAPIASPNFTDTPTAPTVNIEVSSDQIATTAFAHTVATAAGDAAKAYADGLVVNLWDDRGAFDPTAGTWPTSADGGSGVDNAIMKGDTWSISTGGVLTGGIVVEIGDVIRALVDGAGDTSADWGVTENNLGYVAENSANKATDLTSPNNNTYPTTQAVADGLGTREPSLPAAVGAVKFLREDRTFQSILDVVATGISFASGVAITATDSILTALGKLQKQITDLAASAVTLASSRYSLVAASGTSYAIQASDINALGTVIVVATNSAATAITIGSPASLGKVAGDSVNVRQTTSTGTVTLSASSGSVVGNLVFSGIHDTRTLIAIDSVTWYVVGG